MLKNPYIILFLIGAAILLIGILLSVELVTGIGAGVMVVEGALYLFYYRPRVRRQGY